MTGTEPRRVAFLGFGLVAGSVARAVSARLGQDARPTLVAWSPSNVGPTAAVADGVLDAAVAGPAAAVAGADLVVIGAPPLETIAMIEMLAGPLRGMLAAGAVVTDVASTKARVVAAAEASGLRFVGGHPMAGRDASGYAAGAADLFVDRPWVLVPGAAGDEEAVDRVVWLARACGSRPVRMDAATHDRAAAAISHLPLLLAASLVEAVAGSGDERPGWPVASSLAASGWRDMTRLARGDARMGAGIAATNSTALAGQLRDLRAVLDDWIAELEHDGGPDPVRLEARLAAVRDRLERVPGDGA